MLCCFLSPPPTFSSSFFPFLTLPFHFYRLRSAHCALSTSVPPGTEGKMTWQAYPFLIICVCVCVCVGMCVCVRARSGLHASFVQAFSLVALVPAFSDCRVFICTHTHTNADAQTPRCRCKANWEFTACRARERLALLSVLVTCQFSFSVYVFVCLWFCVYACVRWAYASLTLSGSGCLYSPVGRGEPKSIF